MSVEQTSQLIQLIFNSVLMVVAGIIMLGALLVRHTAFSNRLRSLNHEYFHLLNNAVMLRGDRLFQIRTQLQYFRQRYLTAQGSLIATYIALVLLISSTFVIALRSLINWQWLITFSLLLFTAGVAVLLAGVGLSLLDFYTSKRSLWEEINWVLTLGENPADPKPAAPTKSTISKPLLPGRKAVRRSPAEEVYPKRSGAV